MQTKMRIKTAYIEITNVCNLNCMTCYNASGLTQERQEMPVAQLRQAIDVLLPLGLETVLLSGGEPTLHSAFDDVPGLVDAFPQLLFGLVTNGTVDRAALLAMAGHERVSLQVSLDGSCEEVNAKTRGTGYFDSVVANVQQLQASAATSLAPKPILLKMVLSQDNITDAEDFYRLAVSLGCIPEFAYIYRSGNSCDHWSDKALSAQQKLGVLRLIERLNTELGVEAVLPYSTTHCPYVKGAEDMSVTIKVNGNIQPCQHLYDGLYALGNVFNFDLLAIEKKVAAFMDLARQRAQQAYGCAKCLLHNEPKACGRGCLAQAVNLHGDPLGNDGECELRKLQALRGLM